MQDVARREFDEVLDKGDTVVGALMGVRAVYELDLSETLESVRVTTIEVTDNTAELSIRMELFGVETDPLPIKMERVDGRWVMERPEPEVAPRELERPAPATEGKRARAGSIGARRARRAESRRTGSSRADRRRT